MRARSRAMKSRGLTTDVIPPVSCSARWMWIVVLLLGSCAPAPTSIPVTLTAPAPTPTAEVVSQAPVCQIGSTFLHADGTILVAVPSGEFTMGHGNADNPAHRVILSDYWIYSTEVTNQQYSVCVAQGRCNPPDSTDNPGFGGFQSLNKPVVGVTHDQARAYCSFMGGDLPTEAQWEKAARGSDARPYPWGTSDPSCDLLNYNNCTKQAADVTGSQDGHSPYGALNMAGNVYEWVEDWYDPRYYTASPTGDPPGPAEGRARVIRSSGYHGSADQSLSYGRSYSSPDDHRPDLGFRCVVGNPEYFAPACSRAPAIRPEDMTTTTVDCPDISIDVQVTACRYGGGSVVTFDDDHPQDTNASFGGIVGCTLLSGRPGTYPISYECRKASIAVMSSRCVYSGVPQGICPSHYAPDPPTGWCAWDGSRSVGIDCPTGEFYDPVTHCCRITTGEPRDFKACPVGTVFTETANRTYACLLAEAVWQSPEISEAINPPVCGNVCDLTVELCSVRNLVFCPTNCSCLAVGRKCPEP